MQREGIVIICLKNGIREKKGLFEACKIIFIHSGRFEFKPLIVVVIIYSLFIVILTIMVVIIYKKII